MATEKKILNECFDYEYSKNGIKVNGLTKTFKEINDNLGNFTTDFPEVRSMWRSNKKTINRASPLHLICAAVSQVDSESVEDYLAVLAKLVKQTKVKKYLDVQDGSGCTPLAYIYKYISELLLTTKQQLMVINALKVNIGNDYEKVVNETTALLPQRMVEMYQINSEYGDMQNELVEILKKLNSEDGIFKKTESMMDYLSNNDTFYPLQKKITFILKDNNSEKMLGEWGRVFNDLVRPVHLAQVHDTVSSLFKMKFQNEKFELGWDGAIAEAMSALKIQIMELCKQDIGLLREVLRTQHGVVLTDIQFQALQSAYIEEAISAAPMDSFFEYAKINKMDDENKQGELVLQLCGWFTSMQRQISVEEISEKTDHIELHIMENEKLELDKDELSLQEIKRVVVDFQTTQEKEQDPKVSQFSGTFFDPRNKKEDNVEVELVDEKEYIDLNN